MGVKPLLMSLRVPEPSGSTQVLPDGSLIRGLSLLFQDRQGSENHYLGESPSGQYLVREVENQESEALARLKAEWACLQQVQHPFLPEVADFFEERGRTYLVTVFPQGFRLDQKVAQKEVEPERIADWLCQFFALFQALQEAPWDWAFDPKNLVRTRAFGLKLVVLPGQPGGAQAPKTPVQHLQELCQFFNQWECRPADQLKSCLLQLQQSPQTLVSAPATPSKRIPLASDPKIQILAPGTRLATYEVEFLRCGGMSLCYLGKSGSNLRFIKEVRCQDDAGVEALRREFEVMRKLRHSQIPRVHQIFEQDGYLYLVSEFVEGNSLAELSRQTRVSEEELVNWGFQLTRILDYLHLHKPPLIYRDLKPANVLRRPDGSLCLIDFGLLRSYKKGQDRDTQALGTFSTASPEHFTGQTDARSDIFSLGATLFLLSTPDFRPRKPFSFPALREVRADLSEQLEKLLDRCLQQRPDERWPSAQELGQEFERHWKLRQPELPPPRNPEDDLLFLPGLRSQLAEQARTLLERRSSQQDLAEAFLGLAQSSSGEALQSLWRNISQELQSGKGLAEALSLHPKIFSRDTLKRVSRAEDPLTTWVEQLEREERAGRSGGKEAQPATASSSSPRPQTKWLAASGLLISGPALASLTHLLEFNWQVAAGSCLLVWSGGLAAWALRDARLMRIVARTQNLVEDAWTSFALGETEKAARELTRALVESRDKLGSHHLNTLASLHSLANLCREQKKFEESNEYYRQSLLIYKKILPENFLAQSHLHRDWAANFEAQKRTEDAILQLQAALDLVDKVTPLPELEKAQLMFEKGRLHFELHQDPQAAESLGPAMETFYNLLGLKSPLVHRALSYLTRVYVRQRKYRESEKHLDALLEEATQEATPDYLALTEANLDMGLIRVETGRKSEARPYFLRALQLLQHYVGPNPGLLRRVLDGYCRALQESEEDGVIQLISIFTGEREVLRRTLERRPDLINARDNTGWGPIQWATFIGREDIVRWLLARGADPGYDSSLVMGPVHVACAWDRPEALYALLEREPDLNAQGPGGWSPLFWCCLNGHSRLVEGLLKKGADPGLRDENGLTPLHVAATHNRLQAVAALLGAGAPVNAVEARAGASALHLAAARGYLAICDCLVYNQADLRLRDAGGQTPLDLAQRNQHRLLVRALQKHQKEGLGGAARR